MIPQLQTDVTFGSLTTAGVPVPVELVSLNSEVVLRKASGQGTILFQGRPIMLYALDDPETMKSVATQLVKNELATVSEVSRGLGIPPSTLRDAVSAFSTAGIRGLVPAQRGPKGPWKFHPRTATTSSGDSQGTI